MFTQEKQKNSPVRLLRSIGLKLVSLFFLYIALSNWAQLMGLWGPDFLGMDNPSRLYHLCMAVFAPVIAFGLWAGAGWAFALWGVISFCVLAVSELTGISFQPGLHMLLFGLFVGFFIADLVLRRLDL